MKEMMTAADLDTLLNVIKVTLGYNGDHDGIGLLLPPAEMQTALAVEGFNLSQLAGGIVPLYPHIHVPVTAPLARMLSGGIHGDFAENSTTARATFVLELIGKKLFRKYQRHIGAHCLGVLTDDQVNLLYQRFAAAVLEKIPAAA